MRMQSISAMCLSAALFWIVTPAAAGTTTICWIDHVVKAENGLNVFFSREAVLGIGVPDDSGLLHWYMASGGTIRNENGHTQDHLFVKDGVEFSASQMAHDGCLYRVSASAEVGQLTAKATMNLPGLKPLVATQVIRTDGTTSD